MNGPEDNDKHVKPVASHRLLMYEFPVMDSFNERNRLEEIN